MSRVTSKLQVTIPKAVAERFGIEPGSDVIFEPAGDIIRLRMAASAPPSRDTAYRLQLFDGDTARQQARDRRLRPSDLEGVRDRGWKREDLYARGLRR